MFAPKEEKLEIVGLEKRKLSQLDQEFQSDQESQSDQEEEKVREREQRRRRYGFGIPSGTKNIAQQIKLMHEASSLRQQVRLLKE
jgi:hypothetical protein